MNWSSIMLFQATILTFILNQLDFINLNRILTIPYEQPLYFNRMFDNNEFSQGNYDIS